MLILSPVDRAAEVDPLADAGAEELYAGFVPPFWSREFGPVVASNRRSFPEASVPTPEELDSLLFAAALRDVPVHLALNVTPVPDGMLRPMVDFVSDLARRGVRGVIVSDIGLLAALRDAQFRRLDLHASTLFSAFNGASVAFLRRVGASRVVLARELTTAAIGRIAAAAGGTQIEVLGLRGRCPNIEGFCTHLHDDPGRTWPCELRFRKEWRGEGEGIPEGVRKALESPEGVDRRFSCGLCAIPLLELSGVHAFKIVGRGAETGRKVESAEAARRMREWGRTGAYGPDECSRKGKALYAEIHGRPCGPENCCFPEFGPGEDGLPREGGSDGPA